MPTSLPRHTITETPSVKEALDGLRATLGEGQRIDFAELIALGAEAKARRIAAEDDASRAARRRLGKRVAGRSFPYGIDVAAAEEVKRLRLVERSS